MWLRRNNTRWLFILIASSWLVAPGAWANDTEGWFAGVRFGHELAEATYTKSVHYNAGVLPASSG